MEEQQEEEEDDGEGEQQQQQQQHQGGDAERGRAGAGERGREERQGGGGWWVTPGDLEPPGSVSQFLHHLWWGAPSEPHGPGPWCIRHAGASMGVDTAGVLWSDCLLGGWAKGDPFPPSLRHPSPLFRVTVSFSVPAPQKTQRPILSFQPLYEGRIPPPPTAHHFCGNRLRSALPTTGSSLCNHSPYFEPPSCSSPPLAAIVISCAIVPLSHTKNIRTLSSCWRWANYRSGPHINTSMRLVVQDRCFLGAMVCQRSHGRFGDHAGEAEQERAIRGEQWSKPKGTPHVRLCQSWCGAPSEGVACKPPLTTTMAPFLCVDLPLPLHSNFEGYVCVTKMQVYRKALVQSRRPPWWRQGHGHVTHMLRFYCMLSVH